MICMPTVCLLAQNWNQRRADMDRNLELQMMQLRMMREDIAAKNQEGKICENETKVAYANLVSTLSKIKDGKHFVQTIITFQGSVQCRKDIYYVENNTIVGTQDESGNRVQSEILPITLGKAKFIDSLDSNGKKIPLLFEIFFIYE